MYKQMSSATHYEVMYCCEYGGLRWPKKLLKQVFEACPPNTEMGATIWKSAPCYNILEGNAKPNPEWHYYQIIERIEPYVHGYNYVYMKTFRKDHKTNQFDKKGQIDSEPYISNDNKTFYYFDQYNRRIS